MRHFLRPLAVVLCLVVTSGCGSSETRHTVKKVTPEVLDESDRMPSPPEEAKQSAEDRSFTDSLTRRLEEAEAEIAGIATKVAALPEEAHAEWDETVEHLKTDAAKLKREIDELGNTARHAWKDTREKVSRTWESLEQAVKKAASEIARANASSARVEPEGDMPTGP